MEGGDNKLYCGFLMYFDSFYLCQRQTNDSCFWPKGRCIRRYTFSQWGHAWTGPEEHTHTHTYRTSQSSTGQWETEHLFMNSAFLFAPVCSQQDSTYLIAISKIYIRYEKALEINLKTCAVYGRGQWQQCEHSVKQQPLVKLYIFFYFLLCNLWH